MSKTLKILSKPKGNAEEYGRWSVNPYIGCGHGCLYCYLKKGPSGAYLGQDKPVLKKGVVNEEHAYHLAMAEIIEHRDEIIRDGGLFMTFTSDPCMMKTYDLFADINFGACNHGIPVTILTKCAYDIPKKCEGIPQRPCFSPFCISSKMLAIGWTLTGHDELEPNSAPNSERLRYMKMASDKGMMTWASIEPVIDFPSSLNMIYQALNAGCQHFKIGLLTNNTRLVRKDFAFGEHHFDAYKVNDCLHFVEDVMRMTSGKATVYWKQSFVDFFGDEPIHGMTSREFLHQWPHGVDKDWNMFKKEE